MPSVYGTAESRTAPSHLNGYAGELRELIRDITVWLDEATHARIVSAIIDRAARSGVEYLIEAGGSLRDDLVIEAADQYGMVLVLSGIRLFHH